jgi:hypothetical protein
MVLRNERPLKPANHGQKQVKTGKIRRKWEETCGNRAFAIDFSPPEVAL